MNHVLLSYLMAADALITVNDIFSLGRYHILSVPSQKC